MNKIIAGLAIVFVCLIVVSCEAFGARVNEPINGLIENGTLTPEQGQAVKDVLSGSGGFWGVLETLLTVLLGGGSGVALVRLLRGSSLKSGSGNGAAKPAS